MFRIIAKYIQCSNEYYAFLGTILIVIALSVAVVAVPFGCHFVALAEPNRLYALSNTLLGDIGRMMRVVKRKKFKRSHTRTDSITRVDTISNVYLYKCKTFYTS